MYAILISLLSCYSDSVKYHGMEYIVAPLLVLHVGGDAAVKTTVVMCCSLGVRPEVTLFPIEDVTFMRSSGRPELKLSDSEIEAVIRIPLLVLDTFGVVIAQLLYPLGRIEPAVAPAIAAPSRDNSPPRARDRSLDKITGRIRKLEDNESTFTSRVSGLIRSKLKAKTGATEKNIRKIAKEVASKNGVTPGKVKPIIVSLLSQFREAALDQVASPVDDDEAPLIPDAVARVMCILSVGDVKRRDRAQAKAAEVVKADVTALQEGLAAVREELA